MLQAMLRIISIPLGNPIETVVHHLIIGGMIFLSRWDGFHIVSALVYVIHTGQDLR